MIFHRPFHRRSTAFHRACYPSPPYTPLAVEGSDRPVEGRWKPPTALHYLLSFTT